MPRPRPPTRPLHPPVHSHATGAPTNEAGLAARLLFDFSSPAFENRTELLDVRQNVRAGAALLKRIVDRLPTPTVERVATLYNALAKEKVSDYGARVATVYQAKPW